MNRIEVSTRNLYSHFLNKIDVTFLKQLGKQLAATVRNDPGSTSRDDMGLAINACNIGLDIEDSYDWPNIAEWAGVAYMLEVNDIFGSFYYALRVCCHY